MFFHRVADGFNNCQPAFFTIEFHLFMFHVIAQIGFGLAAGVIITLVKPGRNAGGHLAAASIGLIGSLGGVFAGRALFGAESNAASWVASIFGALLVLSIYRAATSSRTAY